MEPQIDTGVARTAKGGVTTLEPSRAERLIARRAAESRATVPGFELTMVVDTSPILAARGDLRATTGPESVPSLTAVIIKACGLALREHPRANASYRDGHFELYSRVNVGVAIAAGDSFIVPAITEADTKTALAIDAELRPLAARASAGTITPPELAGATFTVYNLGMLGVSTFNPPVVPPQAAILAAGAARQVPVVRDGDIVPGYEMTLTLACDHRILYGAHAAKFLARIRALLELPRELLPQ